MSNSLQLRRVFTGLKRSLWCAAIVGAATCVVFGDGLADLTFQTPAGRQVEMSSFKGKVLVLVFSGVQDPQCQDEFKALGVLSEKYAGKDVVLCWVCINPSASYSDERLASPCGPIGAVTVLRDPDEAAYRRINKGRQELPIVAIVDRQGDLHGEPQPGFSPDPDFVNQLADEIDALLATPYK